VTAGEPTKPQGGLLVVSIFAWVVLAFSTLFTLLATYNCIRTADLQTCGPNPPVGMRMTFAAVGFGSYLAAAIPSVLFLLRKNNPPVGLLLAFVSGFLPFVVFAIDVFSAAMC
jgi:hypothetical protein